MPETTVQTPLRQKHYHRQLDRLEAAKEADIRTHVLEMRQKLMAKIRNCIDRPFPDPKYELTEATSTLSDEAMTIANLASSTAGKMDAWEEQLLHIDSSWNIREFFTKKKNKKDASLAMVEEKHQPAFDALNRERLHTIMQLLDDGKVIKLSDDEWHYLFDWFCSENRESNNHTIDVDQLFEESMIVKGNNDFIGKIKCERQYFPCTVVYKTVNGRFLLHDNEVPPGLENEQGYLLTLRHNRREHGLHVRVPPEKQEMWKSLWKDGFRRVSKTFDRGELRYDHATFLAPRISLPVFKAKEGIVPFFDENLLIVLPKKELLEEQETSAESANNASVPSPSIS